MIPSAAWVRNARCRECRLLARLGGFYAEADGLNPAGAVIDPQRGVQHIFI